jgi:hypothetical protein
MANTLASRIIGQNARPLSDSRAVGSRAGQFFCDQFPTLHFAHGRNVLAGPLFSRRVHGSRHYPACNNRSRTPVGFLPRNPSLGHTTHVRGWFCDAYTSAQIASCSPVSFRPSVRDRFLLSGSERPFCFDGAHRGHRRGDRNGRAHFFFLQIELSSFPYRRQLHRRSAPFRPLTGRFVTQNGRRTATKATVVQYAPTRAVAVHEHGL